MTKRIFAIILAIALTAVTLCGCQRDMRPYNTVNFPDDTDLPEYSRTRHARLENEMNEDYITRRSYNSGSCTTLKGDVTVFIHFVNDYNSRWSMSQMADTVRNSVIPGLEFLEEQAKEYNINLSLDMKWGEAYSFDGVVDSGNDVTSVLLGRIAEKQGYDSADDYNEALAEKNNGQLAHLILVNKEGRPYALCSTMLDNYYTENAVIFRTGDRSYDAYSVAHELLHLFGAEDMYDGERAELADEYYHQDIMYRWDNMPYLEVGEATAYQVGWINEPPEVCFTAGWQSYYDYLTAEEEEEEEPLTPMPQPIFTLTESQKHPLDFEPSIDEMRPYYSEGTNAKLEGRVKVVCIYTDDSESSWLEADALANTEENVQPAVDFLMAEAERYGIELDMDIINAFTTVDYSLKTEGGGAYEIKHIAKSMGYENEWKMFDAMRKEYDSNIAFMVFVNKKGNESCSVSSSDYREEKGYFLTEYSINYVNEKGWDRPTLMARQLIYLYGGVNSCIPESRNSIALAVSPADIMLYFNDGIENVEISPATAFNLGWLDTPPEEMYYRDWWDNNRSTVMKTTDIRHQEYPELSPEQTKRLDFEPAIDEMRPYYSEGTNGKLEGKVTLVCIFADDTVSEWDRKDAVAYVNKYVEPAAEYLEEQAAKYDVELEIDIKKEYTEVGFFLKTEADEYFQIKAIAQYMGYENEWQMFSQMSKKYGSNVAFLVVANKEGTPNDTRSSISYRNSTGIFLTEYSMLYTECARDIATSVARRVVYLYGGANTYSPDSREEITRKRYPYDLLLYDCDGLDEAEITEVTAFNLGWLDTPPEEMYYRDWWSDSMYDTMKSTNGRHE